VMISLMRGFGSATSTFIAVKIRHDGYLCHLKLCHGSVKKL